jgi:transcription elongation factor Elf1
MQNKHSLQFKCPACKTAIRFSVFNLQEHALINCTGCAKKYAFTDPDLIRQLKKFEALCSQIHESQEILGNASVGIDIGEHQVKVPYKLLLTRLNSMIDLNIEGALISIAFRVEPTKDHSFLSTKGGER